MPVHYPKMKLSKDKVFQEKLSFSTNLTTILAHPLRLSLLEFIDQFKVLDEQKLDLVFQGDQSVLRTHLDMLISAHLVISTQKNHRKFLTLNYDQIEKTNALLNLLINDPQQLKQFNCARQSKKISPQKVNSLHGWKRSLLTIRKIWTP